MPMLRSMIDQLMESRATPIVLVLAHIGALIWAPGARKVLAPVLVLNIAMAAAILAYNAEGVVYAASHSDWALLALMAFALANLIASGAALAGLAVPRALVWAAFGADFALIVMLTAFMLLFKINNLF
jgi:hypothetical protein